MFSHVLHQSASTLNQFSQRRFAREWERFRVLAGFALFLIMVFSIATPSLSAQQSSRRTAARTSDGVDASSTESNEFSDISNPRVRALFQSNNVLGSSSRDNARRTARSSEQPATYESQLTPAESRLKKTPSASPPIQQARYESTTSSSAAIVTPAVVTSASETTVEQVRESSGQATTGSQNDAEANAPNAIQSDKATPAFLDLTSDGGRLKTSSQKPVGEHGAELSIETSPQHVLYRAVAWIVIALCFFSLAALGIRKWQRSRGLLPSSSATSRVIETLSLGPGRAVSFIEIAGHRAFVAFDAGGIKQLVLAPASFDDEMNLEQDQEQDAIPATSVQSVQKETVG